MGRNEKEENGNKERKRKLKEDNFWKGKGREGMEGTNWERKGVGREKERTAQGR